MNDLYYHSRRNLACWFTLSMGSILILFATGIYGLGVREQLRNFDAELESQTRITAAGIRYRIHRGEWRIKLDDVPVLGSNTLPLDQGLAYVRWYDAAGQLARFVSESPDSLQVGSLGFETLRQESRDPSQDPLWIRQITRPVQQDGQVIGYLQLAAPLTPVQDHLAQERFFLLLGIPIALGTIALTGWWLGGLAMDPLKTSHQHLQSFASQASHELRTPLTQILNHVQLVLQSQDLVSEGWRLERTATTVQTLSHMVGDLLLLARQAHRGSLDLQHLSSFDLRDLVQDLVWDHEAMAQEQGLTFIHHIPTDPVPITAHAELLYRALANLLDNALKYTPKGGQIDLHLTRQPKSAQIQLQNPGSLHSAENLARLFEPFYRGAIVPAQEGMGLGLTLSQEIIQVHQGSLNLSQDPSTGLIVTTIRIPLEP